MDLDSKQHQEAADSIVLEEEIDPNYVPSEAEVVEYAKWLGMDLDKDQDLFWIAREGLMAPLPKNWKPCKQKDTEDIYYFNFTSGESTWDHPCDGYYKRQYEEHKKKKEKGLKESGDQKRSKAKEDVDQLLGKKKKGKEVKSSLGSIPPVTVSGGGSTVMLERKPLPGISMQPLLQMSSSAAPLSSDSVNAERGILSVSGDSMFVAKSKASSKLLAAVASETADAKQVDSGLRSGEFKMELKVDSAPLGSSWKDSNRSGGSGGEDRTVAHSRRPSSAPVGGAESKDSGGDDSRGHGDLVPLFPRNKALPNLSNSGNSSLNRRTDSPVNARMSSPVPTINNSSPSADLRVEQLREDLRREGERCSQLEDDLRALRSKSRDAEATATEARKIAEAASDAIKSDLTSLEFSLRQANNYVADRNAAIENVNTELSKRNQEVQSLSADRSGLQSQLAGLSREISRLAAELSSKTQEATDLSRELSELRQSELRLKRSVKEQEESLQIERDKYLRLDEALSKTISTLRQRNSDLEVSLSIASKTEPSDSKDFAADNAALREATAMLAEHKALVATLTAEIARRDSVTHDATASAQTQANNLLAELRVELQTSFSRYSLLQSDVERQSSQLSSLRTELASVGSEKESALKRNDQLAAALDVANSIASIASTSTASDRSASSAETSLSAVNASLIAQVSQLNVRICELEGDLRETKRKSDLLASSLSTSEMAVASGVLAMERYAQAELSSKEKIRDQTDKLTASAAELARVSGEFSAVRSELREMGATLETERSQSLQKEKKIRSYQEELLQVQKRMAAPADALQMSTSSTQTVAEDTAKEATRRDLVSDTEAIQGQAIIANINLAVMELRSVVTAKEDTIAQMTAQMQEMRAQLVESRLATQSSLGEQIRQSADTSQEDLMAVRKQLDERDRTVKALTAKLHATVEQVVSAETEGNNYRTYWQEAESKLSKAKNVHLQEIRKSEAQLSSTQDQLMDLQAALTASKAVASKTKIELADSQRNLSQLQSEAEHAQGDIEDLNGIVENLRKALQTARENLVIQRSLVGTEKPLAVESIQVATASSADKKFETTVTSSIVELSIVVGKQQANMTRLEEQLQLMSSKNAPQKSPAGPRHHAWNSAGAAGDVDSSGSSDFAAANNKNTFSGRNDSGRNDSARRNVKFEAHAKDGFHERRHASQQQEQQQSHKQKNSDSDRVEDVSSSDDLTLLSLERSPVDAKDAPDRAPGYISEVGRKIESMNKSHLDSEAYQKILNLEGVVVAEAEGFWLAAKAVLRKRSTKISELKSQWKAHNLRGSASGGLGVSSSLINQQVNDLHSAIKISDELGRCIESRRQSLSALREAIDKQQSASRAGGTIDSNRVHILRKELRSEMRLLITLMARSSDNAAAAERDEQRDRERSRGRSRLKEQSFDDSYIQYDRHQVVDRFYKDRMGRAAEAPEFLEQGLQRSSGSRYSNTVASSLEFPRHQQASKTLDQRRLVAQQHIAKIEKQQTDTWKECEDHVNFLTKMRKDLGAVSYSTANSAKSLLFPPNSSHQSDRENTANYNCNMLLSGLESDKKMYEL